MEVTLNSEQEKVIKYLVDSGQYPNAEIAISAAIDLLKENIYLSNEENRQKYEKWLEETRQKIAIGLEQIEKGDYIDGEEVMARFENKLKKARENNT